MFSACTHLRGRAELEQIQLVHQHYNTDQDCRGSGKHRQRWYDFGEGSLCAFGGEAANSNARAQKAPM